MRLEVFGTDCDTPDGTAIRDSVDVADLGEAHLRALAQPRCPSRGAAAGRPARASLSCAAAMECKTALRA